MGQINLKKILSKLNKKELNLIKKLNTPIKIQNYLDTLPINFEKEGETYMSVRRVIKNKKAHCFEGAIFASLCLWYHGSRPLILDLKSINGDDHIVAIYKINNFWGAISKTNHTTLRFRDPIYKNIRELALSYFHEYTNIKTGKKILESFSMPFDLSKSTQDWIFEEKELFDLVEEIDESPHERFIPIKQIKFLRKADKMEMLANQILEWKE